MPVPSEVHLTTYDPGWPRMFESERAALADALGPSARLIEHVGSTAVPRLIAKPTIDIAVGVRTFEVLPEVIRAMEGLGYEYLGEYGLPGRHFFRKAANEPDCDIAYHVHVALDGSYHMRAWLTFRDLLRCDPELRRCYASLKLQLAERFAGDRPSYTAAKSSFIEVHVRRALSSSKP